MTQGDVAPGGIELRAPRRDDLAAVVALMRACDVVEFGRPDTDDADVLAEWDGTGFVLEEDARVAFERTGGWTPAAGAITNASDDPRERMVGYAHTFEKYCEVHVHPERNGRGVGTALRLFTETRALGQAVAEAAVPTRDSVAGETAEVKIWQAPRRANTAAHRLLEAAGYTPAHTYAQMEIELPAIVPRPRWPDGIDVRTFEPGRDEAACHALQNLAWSEYATYEPVSFQRWADLTREPDFDPGLWFLAKEAGWLVGICLCRRYERLAWVVSLGVHPEHRGRGLGEALLRHAFARLRARGVNTVGLSVSARTTPSAWRLYERVGMREAGGLGRVREGAALSRAGLTPRGRTPERPSWASAADRAGAGRRRDERSFRDRRGGAMTAREFRCRECGYPFKTADRGWARDADLMCPSCGSPDVTILVSTPRRMASWVARAQRPVAEARRR